MDLKQITVLVACSPIPSYPNTEVLDRTVESIRDRLPDSPIIFMFDGLNPKDIAKKEPYGELIQKYLWKTNFDLSPAIPLVFEDHKHQSGMTREALKFVETPVILFVEQDTPLHDEIPFEELAEVVNTGYANVIRFHHEAQIHPEHEYLMLDIEPIEILGQPLLRTRQWSQRPHLASTNFYRQICEQYWDEHPRFIEHVMYGLNISHEFDEFRTHIYAPEGTLVRSLHLDGRRYEAGT